MHILRKLIIASAALAAFSGVAATPQALAGPGVRANFRALEDQAARQQLQRKHHSALRAHYSRKATRGKFNRMSGAAREQAFARADQRARKSFDGGAANDIAKGLAEGAGKSALDPAFKKYNGYVGKHRAASSVWGRSGYGGRHRRR